jgi:DNA-binding beta-propeller fold protein YncE
MRKQFISLSEIEHNNYSMKKIVGIILVFFSIITEVYAQTFIVKGKISTLTEPVKYATIKFIDIRDTTQKFSVITDISGNYTLNIVTNVKRDETVQPVKFELEQNYPNPFSSKTAIPYKLNKPEQISIKIYDILGREVKSFIIGKQQAGIHGIIWDGRNNFGNKAAPGIYFYKLQTGNESQVKKMILVRGNVQLNPSLPYNFISGLVKAMPPAEKSGTNIFEETKAAIFKVEISNTDRTSPKIIYNELDSVAIRNDTTINFTVDKVENLYLYVGTAGGDNLFIVDTDLMQREDSLYFSPGNMWWLYITPGGSKIYITLDYPNSPVYYLDTKTRTFHLTNLPTGLIYFNKNRKGFLFNNEGIFILDTLTDQSEKIDTITFDEFVAFDNTSPTFYFVKGAKLYRYDYQQKEIIDTLDLPSVWNMAMTPDNRELYFTTPYGKLGVINIKTGAGEYITNDNPNGQIAITPDGKYVLVTDPGSHWGPSSGSGLLTVVRTSDHSLDGYIYNVWL